MWTTRQPRCWMPVGRQGESATTNSKTWIAWSSTTSHPRSQRASIPYLIRARRGYGNMVLHSITVRCCCALPAATHRAFLRSTTATAPVLSSLFPRIAYSHVCRCRVCGFLPAGRRVILHQRLPESQSARGALHSSVIRHCVAVPTAAIVFGPGVILALLDRRSRL